MINDYLFINILFEGVDINVTVLTLLDTIEFCPHMFVYAWSVVIEIAVNTNTQLMK